MRHNLLTCSGLQEGRLIMPSIRLFLSTRLSSALSLLQQASSLGHVHVAVIVLGDSIKKLSFVCSFEQFITCATRSLSSRFDLCKWLGSPSASGHEHTPLQPFTSVLRT